MATVTSLRENICRANSCPTQRPAGIVSGTPFTFFVEKV
jgi:hypothetical protein